MIFTVTLNTAVDCIISREDYEKYGKNEQYMQKIPAGKGLNVSRALSSMNIPSVCIGLVGEEDIDFFETVADENITTRFVSVPGLTRRNITISGYSDGIERHERNEGFVADSTYINEVKRILGSEVNENDYVIFSGSLPKGVSPDTYKMLIKDCKVRNIKTVLDSSAIALIEGIEASPYMIKPNIDELKTILPVQISGDEPKSLMPHIAKVSKDNNIPYILTTLEDRGALLYIRESDSFIEAPASMLDCCISRRQASSVGCGDSVVAGFVSGLCEGLDISEALTRAMDWACLNLYTDIPGKL